MSLEDPFLIVQNEVFDVLIRLRNSYTQWQDMQENTADVSREEYSALVLELKNGIKSIQWDLDELEESLDSSDRQGKLDMGELDKRRQFIVKTRDEVKAMNEKLSKANTKLKSRPDFPTLPNFGSQTFAQLNPNGTKYTRLTDAPDGGNGAATSAGSGSAPGEHVLFSQSYAADDDSKSPYANDYAIGFDDSDNPIHVVRPNSSKIDVLRDFIHNRPRQSVAAVAATTFFVILLFVLAL